MKFKTTLLVTLGLLVGGLTATHAAITTSGNFKTGASVPTLSIETPITLTITTTGSFGYLIFDEWVNNDGSQTTLQASNNQTISYQINGGATQTLGVSTLYDNLNTTLGAGTANDGLIGFSSTVAVTAGQTLTILPGTLTFGYNSAFNPPPATFTGNVFLAGSGIAAFSSPASAGAVPEPSTYALLLGSAGLFALMQRRRRAGSPVLG